MENLNEKNWIHYLTRPFTLFGSSIWYMWYADYAQRLAEKDISDMVCIEESIGVVRNYRRNDDLEHLKDQIGNLAVHQRDECKNLLNKAVEYNKEAQKYLDKEKKFESLEEALIFFFEIALHSTILPHFIPLGLEKLNIKDEELQNICENLRGVSYYPRILTDIIIPLAVDRLKSLNIDNPEEAIDLMCVNEVLSGDITMLAERKKARVENKMYVYQMVDRKMSLTWHTSTSHFISNIEHLDVSVNNLKGNVVYKGKIQGVARIVTSMDGKGIEFNKGDILISINSNPNLMHLITQAGAIVTDEGGITCHAAIISRELKIPCIIGTKSATKVFKNGDMIEVDADNGVVKILNNK